MKILLLGDSITQGIGKKGINYQLIMENRYENLEFVNLAKSGSTIEYVVQNINMITQMGKDCDVAIIMYGSVDARIRPDTDKNRYRLWSLIPKHYRKAGMMDPRPFYSRGKIKKGLQIGDNLIRLLICKLMFLTQGKCQWCSVRQFENQYNIALENLNNVIPHIILLTPVCVDEKIYGKENVIQYEKYANVVKSIALKYHLSVVDIYNTFKKEIKKNGWDSVFYLDHFHPNINGYRIIADLLHNEILNL